VVSASDLDLVPSDKCLSLDPSPRVLLPPQLQLSSSPTPVVRFRFTPSP